MTTSNIELWQLGFDLKQSGTTRIILDKQRLFYCISFVFQLLGKSPSNGLLFSGPNGIGKSAILVVTFLLCFILGLPVMYIPSSHIWNSTSSSGKESCAQDFFMRTFAEQNADIIAADPAMYPFFQDIIETGEVKDSMLYEKFCLAVGDGRVKRCGYLADEVQALSNNPAFKNDFTIWTGFSSRLCSFLCASAYGMRELSLPSGEAHRLVYVQPMDKDTVVAAITDEHSPFYMTTNTSFANEVYSIIGGVPRSLFELRNVVTPPASGSIELKKLVTLLSPTTSKIQPPAPVVTSDYLSTCLEIAVGRIYANMIDIFLRKFLAPLEQLPEERKAAIFSILKLLRGELRLQPVIKSLYDFGLCYVDNEKSDYVFPVSQLAKDVLYEMFCYQARNGFLPRVSSVDDTTTQGDLFEAHCRVFIVSPLSSSVYLSAYPYGKPALQLLGRSVEEAKRLNDNVKLETKGKTASKKVKIQELQVIVPEPRYNIWLHAEQSQEIREWRKGEIETHPLPELNGIVQKTPRTLWLFPKDYPCDGIIIPAAEDRASPLIIYDCSITDPYHSGRKFKFKINCERVRTRLREVFPNRRVILVAIYSKDLLEDYERMPFPKKEMDEVQDVYIIDRDEIIKIGVQI